MKKTVVITLILILLFNVLLTNFSFAVEYTENTIQEIENAGGGITQEDFDKFINDGKVEGGSDKTLSGGQQSGIQVGKKHDRATALEDDQTGYIEAALAVMLAAIPTLTNQFLTWLVTDKTIVNISELKIDLNNIFTVEKLLTNTYPAFSVNFFSNSLEGNTTTFGKAMNSLHNSVAKWYYVMRTIAIIAALCVLIYVAIRMAISTVADEQAKYKKMLKDWVAGFVLLFVLHYMILFLINIEEMIVSLLATVTKTTNVEVTIFKSTWFADDFDPGSLRTAILLCVFVIMQLMFAWKYFKRKLKLAFLIMISPLITITYAIDKVDDGKAQAFSNWFRSFISTLMLQPLQLLVFMIFAYTGVEIAKFSIVLAIIFFILIYNGEKIFKLVLGLDGGDDD